MGCPSVWYPHVQHMQRLLIRLLGSLYQDLIIITLPHVTSRCRPSMPVPIVLLQSLACNFPSEPLATVKPERFSPRTRTFVPINKQHLIHLLASLGTLFQTHRNHGHGDFTHPHTHPPANQSRYPNPQSHDPNPSSHPSAPYAEKGIAGQRSPYKWKWNWKSG